MIDEYIEVLKVMISNYEFRKLLNEMLKEINEKFKRIKVDKAVEIAKYNMATILVIGIENARDPNYDIKKTVDWYNICPTSYLIDSDFIKFIEKYKYYIELIKNKVEEDYRKNKK